MYEWIGKMTSNPQALSRMARLCGWIPRPCLLLLCQCIAWVLLQGAGGYLRSKVLDNMRDVLGEERRKEQVLRRYRRHYFHNVTITLYEILLEAKRLPGSESWRFRVEGEEHLQEALQLGRGAIIYTPHVGNFFFYYWYLCKRYPCLTVATSGSSELRPIYEYFHDMGCPGLDYDSTPPLEMLRKLKKHLAGNGVVFILGDFWRPTFPTSRIFGKTTRTPEGAASLSIEQQVPLIPFYGHRESGWVHRITFEQPLHLYASFERTQRAEATQLLNRFMERVIREHPEHWFYWFNAEERWEKDRLHLDEDESNELHAAEGTTTIERKKSSA